MAISLNISDGRKEFYINGDPNRSIWVNTMDAAIITRANKELRQLEALQSELEQAEDVVDEETFCAMFEKAEQALNDAINRIFADDIADTVFGLLSPLTSVRKDGTTYFESFLDTIMPVVKKDSKAVQEASLQRMSKYTGKYAKKRNAT